MLEVILKACELEGYYSQLVNILDVQRYGW